MKSIKAKTLHHPEYYFTKLAQSSKSGAQAAYLLKYFPKYYKNLVINFSLEDWPVISKLKRTKVIENLTLGNIRGAWRDEAESFNKLEQRIFRNKRKSVKSLPIAQASRLRTRISTFFPRITSLDLSLLMSGRFEQTWGMKAVFVSRDLERKIWRSYGYFWKGFRCLKHLKMSNTSNYLWLILKEINSSSRLLASLQTLKLSLKFEENPTETALVRNFLLELEKNGHVLSHLSHLNCERFEMFHCYDALMGSILSQCPKLVSLSFPIGREAPFYETAEGIYKECKEIRVLEQMKTMENLRTLSVSAYGIKTLAKHFSVPPSVQKLSLTIGHSFYEQSLLNLFQEPEYGFFERWKGFHNLRTLNLRMRAIVKPSDLLYKFAKTLLEAIPNLKKFAFELVESPICPVDACEPLDFSLFLGNEATLKQLESLKVVLADGGQITFELEKIHTLSNLRKLVIEAALSDGFDPKTILQSFSPSSSENANIKIQKTLNLPPVLFKSVKPFKEFIKLATRRISSGNLALAMGIHLQIDSCQELFDHFKDPLPLSKNDGSLRLDVFLRSSEDEKVSDLQKKEFKRIFGCLNLRVYQNSGRSQIQLI